MFASVADATVPAIVEEFMRPPPSDSAEFRPHAVKLIGLFREMATMPVIPPGQSDDEIRFCLERMNVITPMLHGVAMAFFEAAVTTTAPELLADFRTTRQAAVAGARNVKIALWEELLRRTPEEDEDPDAEELRKIAEARADAAPSATADEVYRRLGL